MGLEPNQSIRENFPTNYSNIFSCLKDSPLYYAMFIVYVDLWAILTGYGYQMISEDQKEAEVVKDSHVVTLVVSNNLCLY